MNLLNREEENIKIGEEIDAIKKIKFNNVDFSYDNKNKILTETRLH